MLALDGSHGEGGGQILRSALALSMITGRPFRIEHIRAGRSKPGLLRQHLAAVNAAATISCAEVVDAQLHSREMTFTPAAVQPGNYFFAVGSAGSCTLVLQTVLPALVTAPGPSNLVIEGGTHNPHAPSVDFLHACFLPLLERMGPRVAVELDRAGFFPRGGGRIKIAVEPVARLTPLVLHERGAVRQRLARAVVADLPLSIAQRELAVVARELSWPADCCRAESLPRGCGPGNFITLDVAFEHVTELVTGFGMRGVPAEKVAASGVEQLQRYLAAEVPVGVHLADQLLLPIALAGGGAFVTLPLSPHATTNIGVIEAFLNVRFSVRELDSGRWLVEVT
jgi:RNA 3'-terminal phosphate cyclase (ATP)